ncbi:MAG TPA: PAS domain-containing protein [Candidatus Cloacimonadota bacterium]|nr:PAS domain-containing protein [Candidatus Cloacimonadota bacterium]
MQDWSKEFPVAITICDKDGIITEMNDKSCSTFASYGGRDLIGKSIYDYHPPHCNEMIRSMLATGKPHSYTIEKQGKKKLIHQQPYFLDGVIAGVVEMSIELPADMPHYVRK